eukprot:16251448-Heterocapsa_arctica.AAC.1
MCRTGRLKQLLTVAKQEHLDILVLTGTRTKDKFSEFSSCGFYVLSWGAPSRNDPAGVLIAVNLNTIALEWIFRRTAADESKDGRIAFIHLRQRSSIGKEDFDIQ